MFSTFIDTIVEDEIIYCTGPETLVPDMDSMDIWIVLDSIEDVLTLSMFVIGLG